MWLWPTRLIAVLSTIWDQTGSCPGLSPCSLSVMTWRPLWAMTMRQVPAAAAGAEAAGTPAVSLVHFLYGPARRLMLEQGSTWTTDLATLNGTRRTLGLAPLAG